MELWHGRTITREQRYLVVLKLHDNDDFKRIKNNGNDDDSISKNPASHGGCLLALTGKKWPPLLLFKSMLSVV
jgi:hypothetical protein